VGGNDLIPTLGELVLAEEKHLPPILLGNDTPDIQRRTEKFYLSVADMLEAWIARRPSKHTQRAYRQDVMHAVKFFEINWPSESHRLLMLHVHDIQTYRAALVEADYAPKTRNRRICALSGFYTYMREAASELRLPINVPNPAHSKFISREEADPIDETEALTLSKARRLRTLPAGEDLLDYHDRAAIDFYLFSGARITTGIRADVKDFKWDEEDPKFRINEKGDKRRTIGLHQSAAETIRDYIEIARITSGPLFRPRAGTHSNQLAARRIGATTMYYLLQRYLEQLPGAIRENEDGSTACVFTPHSLRATTATLLLDAGQDITDVQKLLGHKHVTTTQIYDKRRKSTRQSASHSVPI